MADTTHPHPRSFPGVMISGTFEDLAHCRLALMKAALATKFFPVAMEHDPTKPATDLIEASLSMVREASAYIGVIGRRYGHVPRCRNRNPKKLSLTELEFNEALRLNLPTILFVMGPEYPQADTHREQNPSKQRQLSAFLKRAERLFVVHRFADDEELERKAVQLLGNFARGALREELVLCVPRDATACDSFNIDLEYHLMRRLRDHGMFLRPCPTFRSLPDFRSVIRDLAQGPIPRYLFLIWPEIVSDSRSDSVLEQLEILGNAGCRIVALNEFPKPKPGARSPSPRNLFILKATSRNGVNLLCGEVAKYAKPGQVLLVHASQLYQSAKDRKLFFEQQLSSLGLISGNLDEHITLDTWDRDDAYVAVRKKIESFSASGKPWPYRVIVAANDDMALGVADALDRYQHKLENAPKTKVVGYDGLREVRHRILKKPADRFVATLDAGPMVIAEQAFDLLTNTSRRTRVVALSVDRNRLITKSLVHD
ncbi:MAG: DUF4062 domain-containing protein [Acidobacteria bacterium]|nr:DUF4062 domain-containing protein [Acidobacteriota bacterium]